MIVCACFFYTAGINAMYMFAHHQMARPGSWRHSFIDDVCICMNAYCAKIFPNICRHGFQCNQDLVHHQQRHFSCCHGQSLRKQSTTALQGSGKVTDGMGTLGKRQPSQ